MTQTKICTKCKTEKILTEFDKHKGRRFGLADHCKMCRKKEYWEGVTTPGYLENKRALQRAIYTDMKHTKPEFYKNYRAKKRSRYDENRDHINACRRARRKANPEKYRLYDHNKRARKANVINDLTKKQWNEIITLQILCPYCNVKLTDENRTMDHIVPISKGGDHTYYNVTPACNLCNCSKGSKTLIVWLAGK